MVVASFADVSTSVVLGQKNETYGKRHPVGNVVEAVLDVLDPVGEASPVPGEDDDPVTGLVLFNLAADSGDDAGALEAELVLVGGHEAQSIRYVLWPCQPLSSVDIRD